MSDLKVAIVQTDIIWGDKQANYTNIANKISTISNDTDLIVLPEMFNTGFVMKPTNEPSYPEEISTWLYSQIKDRTCAIVASAATYSGDSVVNRLYFVTSDNKVHTYDKNHLFIHAGEDDKYTKGTKRKIITYKGFRIFLTVCFDLRFPVFNCNNHDYDVMLNIASWPESRRNHWQTLLKARAIENQAYVIACNRVGSDPNLSYAGDSMIIDYNGEAIVQASYTETILNGSLSSEKLNEYRTSFDFLKSQDEFILLL
jgi:predicted amidohydrolase